MKGAFKLINIKGTTVGLHWTFILLLIWILLIRAVAGDTAAQTLWILLAWTSIFICVLLHELGHTFMALHYGIHTKSILLLPIGGIAAIERQPEKPVQEIWISVAGPLVNIAIALLLIPFLHDYVPFWNTTIVIYDIHADNFLFYLHTINIILALFNLIPAFPMDGGRVLRGLLSVYIGPYRATNIAVLISYIISTIFIIAGLFIFNLLLVFFGVFLLVMGAVEKQRNILKRSLKEVPLSTMMIRDFETFDADITVEAAAAQLDIHHQPFFLVTSKNGPVGSVSREDIITAITTERDQQPVSTLVKPGLKILNGEKMGSEVWDELPALPGAILPVVIKGHVAGVINRDCIIEYLLLHDEKVNHSVTREVLNNINSHANKVLLLISLLVITGCNQPDTGSAVPPSPPPAEMFTRSDTVGYYQKMMSLLHNIPSVRWPAEDIPPVSGSILPYKRIVAFYGNLYSAQMGILGALPPVEMKKKLLHEVKNWEQADTLFRVQPALHYVAITAQAKPGKDRKYRLRMPFSQIDSILKMAADINAIVFLDIQVGLSTLQEEIPTLEKYLRMPQVHLGIDPEYSMKGGEVPCTKIGTFDAADINYACQYLEELVKKYQLPPKILVVHRFTQAMVTHYNNIRRWDKVQIVINMDGFGYPAKKINSYNSFVAREPVQYTGFKIFYKNDLTAARQTIMRPEEVLTLYPKPIYIQYQ